MSYKSKPLLKLYKYSESGFQLQAIIDDYQSCSFERNKYEAGGFTVEINYNIPNSQLFEKNLFIQFGNDRKDFGIIVSISDEITSEGKGGQLRTISGYDVRYLFKRRIIKNMNNGATWSMTGSGEVVMRNLINDQCGSNSEEKRQLPITNILSENGIGKEYSVSESYTNLYEVLTTIATQSDVGWYLDFNGNSLKLEFYSGTDRHKIVQFSTEYESLSDGNFSDSSDSFCNVVYVGGKGQNDNRDIYEGENEISGSIPSGLDRFESWDDQSSMSSESEYKTEAESVLSQYGQTIQVDGRGLAKCPYIYKSEFDVGDIITLKVNEKVAEVQIVSVSENWSKGTYNIDFVFGKPIIDLSKQLSLLLNRIQNYIPDSNSTDSVKYYTIPTDKDMPSGDVTYKTIGFIGDVGTSATFKLYFRNDGTGAKTYHVYFKQLSGNGKLILTTGVSGKSNLEFSPGTYVAIIYVDEEGNVKSGTSISDTSVSSSTSWSSEKIQQEITSGGGGTMPIGTIVSYGGENIPIGFLLCDGRAVNRTDYNRLFDAIGTTYGSGDGSTTFNLPNLTDKFIQGATSKNLGTSISAGLPNITGTVLLGNHSLNVGLGDYKGAFYNPSLKSGASIGGTSGSGWQGSLGIDASKSNAIYGNSDTVQPPSVTMYYIIKATSFGELKEDALDDSKTTTGNCWSAEKTMLEIEKSTSYSITETRIGTWVDGKPLYRKAIPANSAWKGTVSVGWKNLKSFVDSSNIPSIDELVSIGAYSYFSTSLRRSFSNGIFLPAIDASGVVQFYNNISWDIGTPTKSYFVIEYTKN